MAAENTCSACSWSPERKKHCHYNSHIKIFYEASDRGSSNFEYRNYQFLSENTSIPTPQIVDLWEEDNGSYFLLTIRIPGKPLNEACFSLSEAEKENIAKQTADYLMQLRGIQLSQMEILDGKPLYSVFLFGGEFGEGNGPLTSDDELWNEISQCLSDVPEEIRSKLRAQMPTATLNTFTHATLPIGNGNVTGILDWEASGFYPVWWESACPSLAYCQEDKEWKALLRKHMPDHTDGRNFWSNFRYL
ncbi:hypothetical protein N7532_009385 [Penicillium argentinense]|uniref:Aminoglycoside phosphotransferase domain-containing protein n=1 Tax=Penicillium argentinense TaxID=1131581 RepID=A0A9W9EZD0_9EURO|nr:uncharacterized protein N7532_009385 [Penicillium argentinense]KAJ5090701.1 hypothetical protein N7532_009385 [Penicillium argentinense]